MLKQYLFQAANKEAYEKFIRGSKFLAKNPDVVEFICYIINRFVNESDTLRDPGVVYDRKYFEDGSVSVDVERHNNVDVNMCFQEMLQEMRIADGLYKKPVLKVCDFLKQKIHYDVTALPALCIMLNEIVHLVNECLLNQNLEIDDERAGLRIYTDADLHKMDAVCSFIFDDVFTVIDDRTRYGGVTPDGVIQPRNDLHRLYININKAMLTGMIVMRLDNSNRSIELGEPEYVDEPDEEWGFDNIEWCDMED